MHKLNIKFKSAVKVSIKIFQSMIESPGNHYQGNNFWQNEIKLMVNINDNVK